MDDHWRLEVRRVPFRSAEIVVTGIRSSLERAAEVKQNSVQVVDSIVAQDISKFPDPTVASSLQRVSGVQVSNDNHTDLSGVRIRGMTYIITTVDVREVVTPTGRSEESRVGNECLSTCSSWWSQYH